MWVPNNGVGTQLGVNQNSFIKNRLSFNILHSKLHPNRSEHNGFSRQVASITRHKEITDRRTYDRIATVQIKEDECGRPNRQLKIGS
jgi:hypothetical protein